MIRTFPLWPSRSKAELDEAMAVLNALQDKGTLTAVAADDLAVLRNLVEHYAAEAHPIPPSADANLLQHVVDAKAVSSAHVAQDTRLEAATLTAVLGWTAGPQHM